MDITNRFINIPRLKQRQTEVCDDQQICPSSAPLPWKGSPRTSVIYWCHREERNKSETGSTDPHICARIAYKGKRVRFSLETTNKDAARPTEALPRASTVVEFIKAVEKFSSVRGQSAYVQAFREIVAEVVPAPDAGRHTKIDNVVGGVWRAAVYTVPLFSIRSPKIQKWKQRRLRLNEQNALQQRRDVITVASSIRDAKALGGSQPLSSNSIH